MNYNKHPRAVVITTLALLTPLAIPLPSASAEPLTSVQKQEHQVDLLFGQAQLRLMNLSPGVIRVLYSADGKFPPQRVPVLLQNAPVGSFKVADKDGFVTVSDGKLSARVDKANGAVTFLDQTGKTVCAEVPGKRILQPIRLPGDPAQNAYSSECSFAIAAGEQIYGLGQHQDGSLDHRLTTTLLQQSNREVAIPFALSSNGYGVLWNNPARTEAAVGGDTSYMDDDGVLDETGSPGGLTGHYFKGINFDTEVTSHVDRRMEFWWGGTPPPQMPHDNYSVRWVGFVKADQTGDYRFESVSDDGARLYVDDKLVIDSWKGYIDTNAQAVVHFEAGSRHKVRYEYFQLGGGADVRLKWTRPASQQAIVWRSSAAEDIDYVVFYGPTTDKVIDGLRTATGRAPLMPKWALGYWQSRERYKTQQELLDVASEYRKRQEPLDNIVQDWFYWDPYPWGSHKFDPARFPDFTAAVDSLHKMNVHLMISVWGKFVPGTPANPNDNYNALKAKGYLYPSKGEAFYDAFNPDARQMYWDLMRDQIYSKGVDAWWLDASEPELWLPGLAATNTGAGRGALVINAWPLMHTTAVYQGQLQASPNKRVFILTRSAYAGQQRNSAATWSGDIQGTWDVLAKQIVGGLNFSLCGIPYWTTDIGGFFVNYPNGSNNPEYRELYTRWFEYGAFCPLFRSHGTQALREMWQFGPDVEKTLLKYDNLRYRLMPYIYSQAWNVTNNNGTIMRALVMDFPNDETAIRLKDEFMFGPSILVCPVISKDATARSVYLPAGTQWIDFWTGNRYDGGKTINAEAPLDTIPLYVRAGSIVPFGPKLQYVDEKPADPIELRVYTGSDGATSIYEDQGDNNDYLKGEYATIPVTWNDKAKKLTIGARSGSFKGMLAHRTFKVVFVRPKLGGVEELSIATPVAYSGSAVTVSAN